MGFPEREQSRLKGEKLKSILKGVWAFCAYVVVPQGGGIGNDNVNLNDNFLLNTNLTNHLWFMVTYGSRLRVQGEWFKVQSSRARVKEE